MNCGDDDVGMTPAPYADVTYLRPGVGHKVYDIVHDVTLHVDLLLHGGSLRQTDARKHIMLYFSSRQSSDWGGKKKLLISDMKIVTEITLSSSVETIWRAEVSEGRVFRVDDFQDFMEKKKKNCQKTGVFRFYSYFNFNS